MVVKGSPCSCGGAPRPAAPPSSGFGDSVGASALQASVKGAQGAAAGREVPLTKVVTAIGKPGVAVAAITRRQHGFCRNTTLKGRQSPLNGAPSAVNLFR